MVLVLLIRHPTREPCKQLLPRPLDGDDSGGQQERGCLHGGASGDVEFGPVGCEEPELIEVPVQSSAGYVHFTDQKLTSREIRLVLACAQENA